jgi:hypothetical protein
MTRLAKRMAAIENARNPRIPPLSEVPETGFVPRIRSFGVNALTIPIDELLPVETSRKESRDHLLLFPWL